MDIRTAATIRFTAALTKSKAGNSWTLFLVNLITGCSNCCSILSCQDVGKINDVTFEAPIAILTNPRDNALVENVLLFPLGSISLVMFLQHLLLL